jgi:hypothetical protein
VAKILPNDRRTGYLELFYLNSVFSMVEYCQITEDFICTVMSLDCKLPNHRRPGNFSGLHIAKSQSEPGNSLGGVSSVAEILPNYRKNQVISLDCICSVVEILPNHRKNWVISLDCVCSVAEMLPNN